MELKLGSIFATIFIIHLKFKLYLAYKYHIYTLLKLKIFNPFYCVGYAAF